MQTTQNVLIKLNAVTELKKYCACLSRNLIFFTSVEASTFLHQRWPVQVPSVVVLEVLPLFKLVTRSLLSILCSKFKEYLVLVLKLCLLIQNIVSAGFDKSKN